MGAGGGGCSLPPAPQRHEEDEDQDEDQDEDDKQEEEEEDCRSMLGFKKREEDEDEEGVADPGRLLPRAAAPPRAFMRPCGGSRRLPGLPRGPNCGFVSKDDNLCRVIECAVFL